MTPEMLAKFKTVWYDREGVVHQIHVFAGYADDQQVLKNARRRYDN